MRLYGCVFVFDSKININRGDICCFNLSTSCNNRHVRKRNSKRKIRLCLCLCIKQNRNICVERSDRVSFSGCANAKAKEAVKIVKCTRISFLIVYMYSKRMDIGEIHWYPFIRDCVDDSIFFILLFFSFSSVFVFVFCFVRFKELLLFYFCY